MALRRLLQRVAERASRRLRRFARRLKLRHHTRTRGDQVLERALDQRRKQEFPRIGLTLATEAAQHLGDGLALGGQFALAHGNVRGAIVTAAQLAPRLNPTGNFECCRV